MHCSFNSLAMNNMDWNIDNGILVKEFEFNSSRQAHTFMDGISKIAGKEAHRPDVQFHSGNKVEVRIVPNNGQSLTEKDVRLANLINQIG